MINLAIMATSVEKWMCEELTKLGLPASEENAKYILGIGNAEEIEEYMLELLDNSDPRTQKFIKDLLHRWRPPDIPQNVQVYRKVEEESYFTGSSKAKRKESQNSVLEPNTTSLQSYLPSGNHGDNTSVNSLPSRKKPVSNGEMYNFPSSKSSSSSQSESKRKQKYIPLFSQEGQAKTVVKIPGRHPCECQASKHRLVANCVKCGRIVCEQEGSGPCLFCGKLVCTAEEQEILARGSKKSEQLRHRLMTNADRQEYVSDRKQDCLPSVTSKIKDGLDSALKHKERLLEYDRTSVRRTQVIDDESDYFSTDSNKWLSTKEREALRKREDELRSIRHASKKDRKITLDFAGRRVIEEEDLSSSNMYDVNDSVVQQIHYGAKPKSTSHGASQGDNYGNLVNPAIITQPPKFVTVKKVSTNFKSNSNTEHDFTDMSANRKKSSMRIQDKEFQEMTDEGLCLSMHQPWASLLVEGIKMHEGRTWYTAHRGRLWIAATAKSPTPEEIADVEQSYKYLKKSPRLEFPSSYPVGCLLGCVNVIDCLDQEEYRKQYPDGESASPYVFICENPQQLVVKFPMKGKHKIYKLDSHIHQGAKKGLR